MKFWIESNLLTVLVTLRQLIVNSIVLASGNSILFDTLRLNYTIWRWWRWCHEFVGVWVERLLYLIAHYNFLSLWFKVDPWFLCLLVESNLIKQLIMVANVEINVCRLWACRCVANILTATIVDLFFGARWCLNYRVEVAIKLILRIHILNSFIYLFVIVALLMIDKRHVVLAYRFKIINNFLTILIRLILHINNNF